LSTLIFEIKNQIFGRVNSVEQKRYLDFHANSWQFDIVLVTGSIA
jgi:hypothetical protein